MPDFLAPELLALRDRAATLAADVLMALRDDPALEGAALAGRVREASKAAGVFRLTQQPGTALAQTVVRDELGRFGVGHLPGLFGPGPGVLRDAGEPLASRYLRPLLDGELRAGFAITEPPDAPRPTWAAIDGDTLVVTGQKSYVTGGGDADFLTATVEVEGRGPSVVVIDRAAAGVTLTRRFATLDGSHHAAFIFDAVRVPLDNLVGDAGAGMRRALGQINEVRLALAGGAVGTCRYVLDLVEARLRSPRRPAPLAESERARLVYGDLRARAYAARSVVYRSAHLSDAGEHAVNEVMAAKLIATETAGHLVDAAIQLVGGEALVEGHPLEAAYRRVRALRLAEGESDQLRVNIARGALDLGLGRI